MKIAKEKLDELSKKVSRLLVVENELTLLSLEHHAVLQRLRSIEASNQQLSQEHAKISHVAQKFAGHKERDGETISKLTSMPESAFKANQRLMDEPGEDVERPR